MILSLCFMLCFSFSCQKGEAAAGCQTSDMAELRNWVNNNYTAAKSGDLEAYSKLWAKDVIWMPQGAPIIKGKSAVLDHVKSLFEQVTMHKSSTSLQFKVSDNFAFVQVNSHEKYTSKIGVGEPIDIGVKAIFLLRRNPGEEWLCTHAIWNNNGILSEENH